MQADGTVRGGGNKPQRGRLIGLLAIVVIAAMVVVWASSTTMGGVSSDTAVPARAGNAYVNDNAGAVHPGLAPGRAVIHDDAGNMDRTVGTGAAIVHDDPWNVSSHTRPDTEAVDGG